MFKNIEVLSGLLLYFGKINKMSYLCTRRQYPAYNHCFQSDLADIWDFKLKIPSCVVIYFVCSLSEA